MTGRSYPTPARMAAHAAVWAASAGAFWLLPHRLARVLALDYEALFTNLAGGYPARLDSGALAVGMGWIVWGAAPATVLLFASLIYRITRHRGLDNPLIRLGWMPRVAVFALGLGCWAVSALPASHALAMWAQVEAYAWIQWADNVPLVMDDLRLRGPDALLPGIVLTGALFLWVALRRPVEGGAGIRPRWLHLGRRVATASFVAVALVAAAPAGGIFTLHGSRIGGARGLGVFEETCGQCHLRSRPLYFVKTPVEWRTTVERMRTFEGAPIGEAEAEAVGDLLCGMRSFSDAWTFRTRCQRCHRGGARGWDERPAEDWERVVERMARWSPHYYRSQVRDQVVDHLVRTRADETADLGLAPETYRSYVALDEACSPCHSVSRAADRAVALPPGARREILLRMGAKRPEPWGAAELEILATTYESLLADEELRARLFPHDLPATGGDLPW